MQVANIAIDEILDVSVSNGVITLVKPFRHKTLEGRAVVFDGKLNLDGKFDYDERVERGLVMQEGIHQGEILKFEKIKLPVLVISKDFYPNRRNNWLSDL